MAPLTLRLLQRWPLARSQWQKALCGPSAFPESEVCMARQVCETAFTRGLLGTERKGRGGRSVGITGAPGGGACAATMAPDPKCWP